MALDEIRDIDWVNSSVACEVALKGVYFQNNSFGPMLELRNIMIQPEDCTCPFADEADSSGE